MACLNLDYISFGCTAKYHILLPGASKTYVIYRLKQANSIYINHSFRQTVPNIYNPWTEMKCDYIAELAGTGNRS